ncbi:MAG: type VI secretion system-associated FHA domain protein TagH [Saezia sp.]
MQERIYLTITNPGQLLPDVVPRMDFDKSGGTIGSRGANWILSDIKNSIAPIHCELQWLEGVFCLIDRSGKTYLNNSHDSLGISHVAQLNDGDIIGVGPYKVHVYFNEIQNKLPDPTKSLEQHSLGELINENRKLLTAHGDINEHTLMSSEHQALDKEFEEISTFEKLQKKDFDPLAALDEIDKKIVTLEKESQLIDSTHFGQSRHNKTQANYIDTSVEAVSYYSNALHTGNHTMEHSKNQYQQEWETTYNQEDGEAKHLAIFPMQQGLQTNLGELDSAAAYNLMLEAGKALKAAINGILQIYDEKYTASTNNLALLTRNLQPIEDNPLRLKQTYDETVQALFSGDRCVVHLSASAAIEESLEQTKKHNAAVIVAIKESLDSLLQAFSPDVMMQRFERYRSESHAQQSYDPDAEAWRMYKKYYHELSSTRQQGFEKLFWEIFEQAYDRAMREKNQ